jgi:hypothetical protein
VTDQRLSVVETRLADLKDSNERYMALQDEEREKAASALRVELERARQEGEARLREHITNQIQQIRGDLLSSDKLELARISEVKQLILGVKSEQKLSLDAAQAAVAKAEDSQKVVNASQNEFRGTLKDQAADLMPRKETEQQFAEIRNQLGDLRSRLDTGPQQLRDLQTLSDRGLGREDQLTENRAVTGNAFLYVTAALAVLAIIVAVYLHTGSSKSLTCTTTAGVVTCH